MKNKVLFWIGLLALMSVACLDTIDQGDERNKGLTGEGITLNLSIEGNRINTYGTVEPIEGEDHIYSLYLFFFEPTIGGTGQFLEVLDISPDKNEQNPGQYLRSGDKITIRSSDLQEGSISLSESYNILLLANARDYLEYYGGDDTGEWNEKFKSQQLTENEMKRLRFRLVPNYDEPDYVEGKDFTPTLPTNTECNYQDPLIEPETLMMSASFSKEVGQETLNADLIRIVSRFDVTNNDANYTLVSASIWNGFRMGTIASDALTDFSIPRIARLYGVEAETTTECPYGEITGGLYCFENYVVSPEQNDNQTTCLILGFEKEGKISYYRVNVCLPGRAQQLRRNNAYQLNIARIKGSGDSNELDAYQSTKQQIEFQINYWDRDNQGAIVYDGDNILAITSSTIVFPFGGGTETIDIFTAGEGTLEIAQDATPNGISATLTEKELTIIATQTNEYKDGFIKLKYGKLDIIVNIRQTGSLEQVLDITPTKLSVFKNTAADESESVTVTSSGEWTAVIYNGDNIFEFVNSSGTSVGKEITGGDNSTNKTNDSFTIKAIADNPLLESRHAFVHFTLDENPDLARVLILTQNGSGNIDVRLNDEQLAFDGYIFFDADGKFIEKRNVLPENDAVLIIDTGEDQSSEYKWVAGFPNGPGNFSIQEIPYSNLEVKAERNKYDKEQVTTLRIQSKLNSSTHQLITLKQEAHSITYTPAGFALISANGGSSEEIKVTASAPFTVELTSDDIDATFDVNGGKTLSVNNNYEEYSFKINFPRLLNHKANPIVTVKMTINGTEVSKSFEIKQTLPVLQEIIVHTTSTTFGTLYHNTGHRSNYVQQLYLNLNNTDLFGPNEESIFPISGVKQTYRSNYPTVNKGTSDIVFSNLTNGSAASGRMGDWVKEDSKRVLVALQDLYAASFMKNIGLPGYENVGTKGDDTSGNHAVPVDHMRTVNGGDYGFNCGNNKLYEYLFKTGPFTQNGEEIEPTDVKLLPYDDINNALYWDECPNTMIPLILYRGADKDYLLLGVDPTNRFIFCGEMELFGNAGKKSNTVNGYTGADNYTGSMQADANSKFLNNLIAWMMNIVLYGDEFTNQFK